MSVFTTASSSNAGDIAIRPGTALTADAVFLANAKRLAQPRKTTTPYSKFLQAYAVVPTPAGMHRAVFTSNAWKQLTPEQQDSYGTNNAAKAQAKLAKAQAKAVKDAEREAAKTIKAAEREAAKAQAKAAKAAEREAVKAAKAAEREAAKATKAAEREAAKATKATELEAAKVTKAAKLEATKAAKAAELETAKAQAKAAKAAEREAVKAVKAAEREAAKAAKAAELEATKALVKPKKVPCSFILFLNATRTYYASILAEANAEVGDGLPVQQKDIVALASSVWRDTDNAELRDLWADRHEQAKHSEFSDRQSLIDSWVETA